MADGREIRNELLPDNVSPPALSIARMLDRLCRSPGEYMLTITIPVHRRRPWQVLYKHDNTQFRTEHSY